MGSTASAPKKHSSDVKQGRYHTSTHNTVQSSKYDAYGNLLPHKSPLCNAVDMGDANKALSIIDSVLKPRYDQLDAMEIWYSLKKGVVSKNYPVVKKIVDHFKHEIAAVGEKEDWIKILCKSSFNGWYDILESLFKNIPASKKYINSVDEYGKAPIHYVQCDSKKSIKILKTLIELGDANPNQQDTDGNTVAHYAAAYSDSPAVILYLHNWGIDFSKCNCSGYNPAKYAWEAALEERYGSSHFDIIPKTIEHFTKINQDNDTPISYPEMGYDDKWFDRDSYKLREAYQDILDELGIGYGGNSRSADFEIIDE